MTFGDLEPWAATYREIPCTARLTFSNVNSSATSARQPEVPNLICVAIRCLVSFE